MREDRVHFFWIPLEVVDDGRVGNETHDRWLGYQLGNLPDTKVERTETYG